MKKKRNRMYSFFYCLVWPFFNLVHPARVFGREHIPEGGALFCANHSSLSDPFFAAFALGLKNQLAIMAKSELMRIPVIGAILKAVGVFGVDRGKKDVGAVKTALKHLKDGDKMLIFPEGTRVKDAEEEDAKTGAMMMAMRTGVPVVPMYIETKKHWFSRTKVVIGEAYHPQSENARPLPEDYRREAAKLKEIMYSLEAVGK